MTEANEMQEARKDIEQLLDHIDEDTSWNVTGYEPNIDPYQLTTVTFTVELQPTTEAIDSETQRERIRTVKDIISELETENKDGAKIPAVIEWAVDELDIDEEKVKHELDELKSQGEIYEPTAEYLRTT